MRRNRLIGLLIAVLCCSASFLLAADLQNQNWLAFEQGNSAFSSKEFGHALQLYKDAIAGAGIFPEAEIAIGNVYLEEGESALALAQYKKAYTMKSSLYIPDQQYEVLYKIANIYKMQQLYGQMEQTLLTITSDDKHFIETSTFQMKTQIKKNYLERGLDRVLMLYVFDDQFAAKAHSLLGWYYYRSGRQSQSLVELLYSLISRTTEIVTFLHDRDTDYEFSSLSTTLIDAAKNKEATAFLKEVDFFKDVYYLACTTYAGGYPQTALAIWKMIAQSTEAGTYQDLSKRQIKSPWIEPLLPSTVIK
jgi:tetratricopeptide (TPR) repeat protein